MKPDLITLQEINLKKNKSLDVKGYTCYNKNRVKGNMGGVATCVADEDAETVLKLSEGHDGNEYIITRHSKFLKPINVINYYGCVESRHTVDEVEEKWKEIVDEMLKIEARDEEIIAVGDFNKHLGSIIKDNNPKVSHGGKMLNDFLSSDKYVLVNSSDKVSGKPFTRYEPSDPNNEEKKSTLDLVIVSKGLYEYVESLKIDSNLEWTPCRPISKAKVRYSDHYALLITFKDIPLKNEKRKVGRRKDPTIWNTKKKGAWDKYFSKSNNNVKLDNILASPGLDVNQIMKILDKTMESLKYSCFGKVSMSMYSKEERELSKLQKQKMEYSPGPLNTTSLDELNERLANALNTVNKVNYELELKSLVKL